MSMTREQTEALIAEVLEVYRIASAHDGRDPAVMLREMGLPVPKTGATPQHLAAPEQDKP